MDFYIYEEYKLYAKSALKHAETCPDLNGWDYYVSFRILHRTEKGQNTRFEID